MIVSHEIYGFNIEIRRHGKTTLVLTFEEIPVRRKSAKKHYYCCIDVGIDELNPKTNKWVFSKVGSFEISDWFNFRIDIKKRNKLKSILGVVCYNELVEKVNQVSEGKFSNGDKYIRAVEQYG